eukprot:c8433_g1_i1.p1 GENE.c8433_g1_i1~~c8433_g1_i1.p1  ORF type:complete len:732 (+),score=191.79 c8433_g1_i1:41-2197(+)
MDEDFDIEDDGQVDEFPDIDDQSADEENGTDEHAQDEESSEEEVQEGDDDDDDNKEGIIPDSESSQSEGEEAEGAVKSHGFDDDDTNPSDDERPPITTIGNIPIEWYDNLPHIGYDLDGNPITKRVAGDALDELLRRRDDPDFSRTIVDDVTGEEIKLTDKDLDIIRRIRNAKFATEHNDQDDPICYFTDEVNIHPLSSAPPPKTRFVPSKWEAKKIVELIKGIRQGRIKTIAQRKEEEKLARKPKLNFDLWETENTENSKFYSRMIPAPKMKLPGHAESYNPPKEYLYSEEEKEAWLAMDPLDRPLNFIPQKFSSLREVPLYANFIKERFERCLDLYLCPRVEKQKIQIDLDSLVPKLPQPKDLRPFPNVQSLVYIGHTQRVRSISIDPRGEWLCTGSDDGTVRIWDIATTRCVKTISVGTVIESVAWNPAPTVPVIAVVTGSEVLLLDPGLEDPTHRDRIKSVLITTPKTTLTSDKGTVLCEWVTPLPSLAAEGILITLKMSQQVRRFAWHRKGEYFATVSPKGESSALLVHHLTKCASQRPFAKTMGHVECALFHPSKPLLFVALLRHVCVFNLQEQKRTHYLSTGLKMISSLAIHPQGDNLIVGSYDRRVVWFDLDMGSKPYKVLRFHQSAVRQVQFHSKLPLFASASDDASIHIFHGMVTNNLSDNAVIVPLKVLRGHTIENSLGVIDCVFHPSQPWIFSAGADHSVRLYVAT